MGVAAARFLFLAFVGLTGAITYNALYLQDVRGTPAAVPLHAEAPKPAPVEIAKLPPVKTDIPPVDPTEGKEQLLMKAVQRELGSRGYDVGAEDGKPNDKTRAAITTYEKTHGLPVTGEASDALLRHILLGDTTPPGGATGSVVDDTKAKPTDQTSGVKAVQQELADLGYAPGAIDGDLGAATTRAIKSFQKDRKLAQTGRITPDLLAELKRVTGHDLTRTASKP
jgi:peptidoglycan hydrolase-like protein with peptidoglycan-binding domain